MDQWVKVSHIPTSQTLSQVYLLLVHLVRQEMFQHIYSLSFSAQVFLRIHILSYTSLYPHGQLLLNSLILLSQLMFMELHILVVL